MSIGVKVALLIDEFFGAAGTAYGGYGFLARNYIAKYLPNNDIQLDVLLGFSRNLWHENIDGVNVYKLPSNKLFAWLWLRQQKYDVYLSIELTSSSYKILKLDGFRKKLLLWVQDPRPWYEWREINTVKIYPETCYWNTKVYEFVHELYEKNKVEFITQGYFLISKAMDLYRLDNEVVMDYLPNPIDVDNDFQIDNICKENKIIFLGRIESVKRGWLFCEIAKKMPEYKFYVLGDTFREKKKNIEIIDKYKKLKNIEFVGHVEGEEKIGYLKSAKILINTSIHEALPVSFLEALSYGTLLVSNRNPEGLTEKFGKWVGDVYGDGFDKVDLYVKATKWLMEHEQERQTMAVAAIDYVRKIHNREYIINKLRTKLIEMI